MAKDVVLDKVVDMISKRRFNNQLKSLSSSIGLPDELKRDSLINNTQLLRDKVFLLNLIQKIAKNKKIDAQKVEM